MVSMSKWEIGTRCCVHRLLGTTASAGLLLVVVCGSGLNKSKSIEDLRIWVYGFVMMRSVKMRGDCQADRCLKAIGKREWLENFATDAVLKREGFTR
jgi:hypothetical protein